MRKQRCQNFLKLIVDLVIICTILIAAALLVPPLAGVKTVMNDNSTAETNLPVGSVAYGKQTDAVNLKKGQKIGEIQYSKGNIMIHKEKILAQETINKADFFDTD